MPPPGDASRLGTLFDRDSFRPGNGPAADRCGMVGHDTGEPLGEIGMPGMEGQERQYRLEEILDVLGLSLVPASGIGLLAFRIAFGGPLSFEFGPDLLDDRCRCPNASEEDLPALSSGRSNGVGPP